MKAERTCERWLIRLNSRVVLKEKLLALWGPIEAWPVEWNDITPSIDIWADQATEAKSDHRLTFGEVDILIDKMVDNVLECLGDLREERTKLP